MARKTEDRKIYEPEEIREEPLPESIIWEAIIDAPKTLAELSATDGAALAAATTAITGLGDLAYEDLVTELQLANAAVTNAKIAVDAIQGDVIAASAITAVKISNGAIEAVKIASGAVTAGKIAAGAVTATEIASGAITAGKISSGAVIAGKIAAGAIDGITITGSLIRTASSGIRVQLNNSSASLEIYDASRLRMQAYQQGLTFWDSSGNNVADIYAGTTGGLLITTANSGSTSRSIHIQAGASGQASLGIGGTTYLYADGSSATIRISKDIEPIDSTRSIGAGTYAMGTIKTTLLYFDTVGYVNSGGTAGSPYPASSFAITHLATGRYQITHPFGTSNYVVVIVPVAGAAKVWSIETRDSSKFIVRLANFSGSLEDNDFMFIFIPAS